jgi:branched-chain amino acid transport system permease protein
MEQVVTNGINVLVVSALYILVALGFSFLFNLLGILNLAHGAIYMLGGYLGYVLIVALGLNEWLALLATVAAFAGFGIILEKYFFRPLVGNFDYTILVCVALAVVSQTTVNLIVGYGIQAIPPFYLGMIKAGTISVSAEKVITFVIAGLLLVFVTWFVKSSKWGLQMQAISQNREAAALQGIDVNRISGLATAMACGLAAIAGCLMGAYLSLGPFMGDAILVKVLILVIIAGLGSVAGIFYSGLLLGILDVILPLMMDGAQSEAVTIGIVVILLLFRPQGFFGRQAT